MGYVNVYEFGGIEDWTGDIVTGDTTPEDTTPEDTAHENTTPDESNNNAGEKTASLSFESFDGGGPEFDVAVADESIVSYDSKTRYYSDDHEELCGAGYDKIFTFTGIKPGETTVLIEERSPIADNLDHTYKVTVDDELNVQIEQLSVKDINEEVPEELHIKINSVNFKTDWEDNESVRALKELCPLTVKMSMYGGFEQVGSLGQSLPRNDEQITADYGDIMLYSGDQIVLFYGSNSWSYTRLGHIHANKNVMEKILANRDVTVELTIE
ncbi:MAG: protease inhibitor I42 family protein [Lachnospiraceae bacterium]|nr:protease inhibitor I42 family protein [Lachnospiraceae bacterium]